MATTLREYLDKTGVLAAWDQMKSYIAGKKYAGGTADGGTANKAASIPFGTVDSTSVATAFTATVDGITELRDGICVYLKNTVITSAAASTAPKCFTLNINGLGAKPVYQVTAAASFATTHFTKNYKYLFTYDSSLDSGNGGWYIGQIFNSNTTYSDMTQAEITAGTGTTGRKITPRMLRDNFYTEDEVDNLIEAITPGDENVIETVKVNGTALTPDANKAVDVTVPTESTVSGWGFTKNTGTYSKPSGGIPASDLAAGVVPIELNSDDSVLTGIDTTIKAIEASDGIYALGINNAEGTEDYVLATTDQLPTEAVISGWGFTKNTGTYSKPSGGIPKTDLAAGVIPTVPTNVSAFTNDAGYTTNTGTITGITMNGASKGTSGVVDLGTVLTAHQDISGKEDKLSIDSTAKTASFTASVGNYYNVSVAASGSITITLTTPADNTKVSSCMFFVSTSTSPTLNFSAASGVSIYKSKDFAIEESTYYELNALWNGTSWYIAQMELEVQV